jgi:hypothetical protein
MCEKKQGKPMAGTDRTPIGAVNGAVFCLQHGGASDSSGWIRADLPRHRPAPGNTEHVK